MYNAAGSSISLQKNHLRDVVLLQKLIHEMKFYFKNLTRQLHNPELPKDGWPSNRGREGWAWRLLQSAKLPDQACHSTQHMLGPKSL